MTTFLRQIVDDDELGQREQIVILPFDIPQAAIPTLTRTAPPVISGSPPPAGAD